ncbi:uncharacterized protein Z518_08889 [Rhinocladiella mackenziei CBS 650.93]|uniref:Xylanolytic transcriptional activator regulatory domain-containing protein n=1 Tax=Rhinocladiella mackenziei CBS 650.93 TaxID=1442369 RepID=A0A0D2I5U2_9EURO|nr:uncharacterized protein Z518_08889 [Rhinocladiella mackenziei CBS 650.93]KIX01164.1 hypothetical protein Z518_08889 [Rhinocladiella mackenziei CBS 650.93]
MKPNDSSILPPTTQSQQPNERQRHERTSPSQWPIDIPNHLDLRGESCSPRDSNGDAPSSLSEVQIFDFRPYSSPKAFNDGFSLRLRPETEYYLFDLYFDHFNTAFPLFDQSQPRQKVDSPSLSPRLKLAMFTISSRFAKQPFADRIPSPTEFASAAEALGSQKCFSTDEIKSSFLLCVHHLSESLNWHSWTECGKLTRMAHLWSSEYIVHQASNTSGKKKSDLEEYRSIWWSIVCLDTCCNSLASIPHGLACGVQNIPLPEFPETSSTVMQQTAESDDDQYLDFGETSYWELMTKVFKRPFTRSRHLYYATCGLMAAVTDYRFGLSRRRSRASKARLRELQNDIASAKMALPTMYFNPTRCYHFQETEREHHNRLDVLLLVGCADLLLSIAAAQSLELDENGPKESAREERWQSILAKAYDIVPIIQSWSPQYFEQMDPMCAYIVFLSSSVLTLEIGLTQSSKASDPVIVSDIKLLLLFLRQIGQYWPVGCRLESTVSELYRNSCSGITYQEALKFLWNFTALQGRMDATKVPPAHQGNNIDQSAGNDRPGQIELPDQQIDMDGMDWLDDPLVISFGKDTNDTEVSTFEAPYCERSFQSLEHLMGI